MHLAHLGSGTPIQQPCPHTRKLPSTKPQGGGQGLQPTEPFGLTAWREPLGAPARHLDRKLAGALGSGKPSPGTDPASLAQCLSPVSLPVSVFSSRAEPLASPAGCSSGFSPRSLLPAAPIHPTHGTNNKPGASSTCCCVSLGWEGGGRAVMCTRSPVLSSYLIIVWRGLVGGHPLHGATGSFARRALLLPPPHFEAARAGRRLA